MKLYYDYKKQFNIILLGILLIVPIAFSGAQNTDDLQNKISQRNTDIDNLEQEIKQYQGQLDDLGKQKSSLNVSLKELDITGKKLQANISITQNKIENTNLKIKNLSSDINNKQASILNDTESIRIGIKSISELESNSIIETILSKNTFSDTWNDIDNMTSIYGKIREKIGELKQVKTDLENTKKQTLDARNELLSLKSELADQKRIVDQNTSDKKKLLAQTKNNESNYQKLLKDRLAKKDAFEKELRDYESQLKFILDPSKLPSGGVLSWPVEKVYITQFFGKTEAGKRLYANGTHNGVDFRASVGTPIMAMADGTVKGTGNTDLTCVGASFGKFVFIQYNNGLSSTFGHLSLIKVSEGQKIKRGEIVGYSGNTGYSTGPHLHVSLYASQAVKMDSRPSQACGGHIYTMPISPINAYLDPMYYLPPYNG